MKLPRVGVTLLAVSCFLSGCTSASVQSTGPDPTAEPFKRFSVLTYNTLHGLAASRFWVTPGESKDERAARFKVQFEQLARAQPEVILLQEVNPLPEMAEAYVEGLRNHGLEYAQVHQVDACGVRLAPGFAVVPGLNNGLAVVAKAPLQLRKLEGLKLSGGFGGCYDFMGMQTGEMRYALIAEVENPATKKKLLAVSLHLHSGIERDQYFIQRMTEAEKEGRIQHDDYQEILAALTEDQERRLGELRMLVDELHRLHAEERYAGVIIGGDFNFEPGSPEYRELERAGLRDTYVIARSSSQLYTYDPQQNPIAIHEEVTIPAALTRAIRNMPPSEQQKVIEAYRKGISQARRIDFLFAMSAQLKTCVKQELFGQPSAVPVHTGSDHYGVLDTYILDPGQC